MCGAGDAAKREQQSGQPRHKRSRSQRLATRAALTVSSSVAAKRELAARRRSRLASFSTCCSDAAAAAAAASAAAAAARCVAALRTATAPPPATGELGIATSSVAASLLSSSIAVAACSTALAAAFMSGSTSSAGAGAGAAAAAASGLLSLPPAPARVVGAEPLRPGSSLALSLISPPSTVAELVCEPGTQPRRRRREPKLPESSRALSAACML